MQLKKDQKSLARKLGYSNVSSQFAIEDDYNPVWEDIDYESDDEFEYEARWRENEKVNGDRQVTTISKKELKATGINRQRQYAKVYTEISTRISIN